MERVESQGLKFMANLRNTGKAEAALPKLFHWNWHQIQKKHREFVSCGSEGDGGFWSLIHA
jgi:hypothetical protein